MTPEATPGQQQVLQFIQETIRGTGSAPTLQEIADRFKKSTGAVQTTLDALRAKGYIEIVPRKARGIQLTERGALQEVRVTELRAALEAALEEAAELPTLFHAAQGGLPKAFRMEQGILWVRDTPRRRFLGPRDFGIDPPDGFRDELPLKAQALPGPLWVLDRAKVNETALAALFAPHVKSFLIVPVREGEELLGVLAFTSSRAQKAEDDGAAEASQAAADLLVGPIRRAAAQFRLQEDLKLHRLLLDLVKQLAGDLELSSLLQRIFRLIEKLVSVDAMFIAVRRPDGRYEAILETDLDDSDRRVFFPVPRLMEPDKSRVAESVEEQRYVLINRSPEELQKLQGKVASGDPWYPVGNPARRSASLLYVPMWFGDEFQGMMSVQSYRMNAYRHEDAERLLVIGEYVGLAVRNARLLESARKGEREEPE
jgi:GAF domain-containing protein